MPQAHSDLYQQVSDTNIAPGGQRLKIEELVHTIEQAELPTAPDGNSFYDKMADLLREVNDAQFGIVSKLIGTEWIRDATESLPLQQRISHDSPVIAANNMLLRCLSRLRPIDYAINQKYPAGEGDALRHEIKQKLSQLTADCLVASSGKQSETKTLELINTLEKNFDTFLVEQLHKANLTTGCETQDDAKKLLFHYRNLSSVMVPARTMITLTYDKKAQVFQRETQYPVTQKTQKQKDTLKALNTINQYPFNDMRNSHNVHNVATQGADSLFADLIAKDDRSLAAQSRKSHLVGTKNAFIVKNELIKTATVPNEDSYKTLAAEPNDVLWLARTGIPVYVGKGENEVVIQEHAQENLTQIRSAAKTLMEQQGASIPGNLALHVTCLNTESTLHIEGKMVKHLRQAAGALHDHFSYAPINLYGTTHDLALAPQLFFAREEQPKKSAPGQKATRLENVVSVVLQASKMPGAVSLINCASGQDRTGTVVEKSTQRWMEERYHVHEWNTESIHTERAKGGNAAEIATHLVHGAPGMKAVSMANNMFGKEKSAFSTEANEQFYRTSADINKKNPVGQVDFLKKPSNLAVVEYLTNLHLFKEALKLHPPTDINKKSAQQKLYKKGENLFELIKKVAGGNPKSLDAKSLSYLSSVLSHCTKTLVNPDDKENLRQLAGLAKEASKQTLPSAQKIKLAILTFVGFALIVAGLIAIIPTGGASVVLTLLGAATLGGARATYKKTPENKLAEALIDYKSTLAKMKNPTKEKPEPDQATPQSSMK